MLGDAIPDVSVAILAGGQSRRMGRDKAFLPLAGKPMIQHVIDAAAGLRVPVLLIANEPGRYRRFGLPVYTDRIPGGGALGGVYTALLAATTPYVVCLACDMPFVRADLLRYMIAQLTDESEVVIPEAGGHLHPLHAIYRRSIAPLIADQLARQVLAIRDLLTQLHVLVLPEAQLNAAGFEARPFVNLNTPEDLKRETQ